MLGNEPAISASADDILKAGKLILPGVGHFGKAMESLNVSGKLKALHEAVLEKKTPILGICLGMQIMTKSSEEAPGVEGLGWFDARLQHFNISDTIKHKVPHMGWNTVTQKKESRLLTDVGDGAEFYFLHSFHLTDTQPADELHEAFYEHSFIAALEKENIFGVQYHPEKSHTAGMQIFKNFLNL